MKTIIGVAILLSSTAPAPINAPSRSRALAVQELADSIGQAYVAKKLSTLDSKQLIRGTVTVVIEHSLIEGKGQFETRRFKTFAKFEAWLNSREREGGAPFRQIMPLKRCAKGLCSFNFDGGILHNQLYIHDISYRLSDARAYITKIHLLDGD